jgi:L-lactate dehydrogenase (cytochrome)
VNVADLRDCAKARAHKMVFDYIDGGADDEITLNRSRSAYSELEMHFNVLSGHGSVDMKTSLFGSDMGLPFFCAPTAGQRMFHRDGEAAAATVCAENDMLFCLSALGTTGLDEVAAIHGGPKLLQLYLWKDRAVVRDVLQRAKEAGFTTLALTADTSWFGNRERDPRNGFTVPPNYSAQQVLAAIARPAWSLDYVCQEPVRFAVAGSDAPADSLTAYFNSMMSKDYSWRDAEWLLGEWNGQTALKGVCRPEDATRAVEMGFDAVWISNHGGRQLETSPPTVELIPAVRAAIGPDVPLVVDGGITRGTHIAKALCLGATAVGVGRAYLYGLAAAGTPGVRKAVDILKRELEVALGLLGVASVDEARRRGPELVRWRRAKGL